MKKRLRKKLHLREFQQMCFAVRLMFTSEAEGLDSPERRSFWHRLVAMLESNDLLILGMADDFCVMTNFYKLPDGRWKNATDTDQQTVKEWLDQQPEIASVRIGPLANAWRQLPEVE
jgi:uncharacterized protein YggL (DUF469 family)